MIKECNNIDLERYGIEPKYYLFYQTWKELTERKTLDSYQYHIMNSLEILNELNTVIGLRLNGTHNTNHNVMDCKSEAQEIIGSDQVIKEKYFCTWKALTSHLNKTPKTDAELRALRYQIQYSYNILRDNYFEDIISSLEADIQNSNKLNIIKKANMIISNCVSRGWSTLALRNIIDILQGTLDEPTYWEKFKNRLLASTDESYCIYIPFDINLKNTGGLSRDVAKQKVYEEIQSMGIGLKEKSEIVQEYEEHNQKIQRLKSDRYMCVNVQAHDYYSACYKAVDKCTDILNILSFYNYIDAWNTKSLLFLAVNTEKNTMKTVRERELYGTYDYIESSQRIYRVSKEMYIQENTSLHRKLHATFAYCNMGKAASAQEEKFMNTWIALESLCRGDVYDNIISNILETVPRALCLRYIYQHFRNFIEDCMRCSIELNFSVKSIDVSATRAKEDIVGEILEVFKDAELFRELIEKCSVNDLLVERCKELQVIATDQNKMFEKIKHHYTTVRSQLSRLYRIRNNIAHNALVSSSSLMMYIEHLDDYLSSFVTEVVVCANKKHEDSMEVIFEIVKDNYNTFCDITDKNGKNRIQGSELLLEKLLKYGIIDLI